MDLKEIIDKLYPTYKGPERRKEEREDYPLFDRRELYDSISTILISGALLAVMYGYLVLSKEPVYKNVPVPYNQNK